MIFNSLAFLVFLPVVFTIYWLLKTDRIRAQNIVLLAASLYFYACWDWRFLFLLLFSICLDYYTGIKIDNSTSTRMRKTWMVISIGVNLGFLMVFKYYNFFIDSFKDALAAVGYHPNIQTLQLILPVGISFYTFHGLSYILDIYYKRIRSERNFIDYALFVSFFPLLVAGPIERATHLLPQIKKRRQFNYAKAIDGLRQMLWGFFKKVVIADNCALYVNDIFSNHSSYGTVSLILGAILFAVQIYCDFSGYSDIALGTARLFGFELLRNFSFPYFSRNIAEFWRRWHISLSSWFRDYVYIPLGGSKGGLLKKIRNTFVIFLVSGFWHGANWTFIIWGGLNAVYYLPSLLLNQNRKYTDIVAEHTLLPSLKELGHMALTFTLTTIAWIFFRADNLNQALEYLGGIFSFRQSETVTVSHLLYLLIGLFFITEWMGRKSNYALEHILQRWPRVARLTLYYLLIILICWFAGEEQEFIYFQF